MPATGSPEPSAIAATPEPTPTPAATATSTPVPTVTLGPTLDPATVEALTGTAERELLSRDIEPLCLRWEDSDDDGEPEWLGLYLRQGDPPRLEGFVLDGEAWYTLAPPAEDRHGLGRYPVCELEVRDVNADGSTELLIWGRAVDDVDLLHMFVWREMTYDLLASFRGDAGIDADEINGDLAQEIIARYRAGDGLAWEQIHTWDGSHYGWTWERYTWLYADHPHAYPTNSPQRTAVSFYLALNDRDLPGAHRLFSSAVEGAQRYEAWAAGFDTMLAVEVGSVNETHRAGDTATVTALVRSYDNLDGYIIGRLWDVTWSLVREGEVWQLEQGTSEELDRWEAVYFP